MLWKGFEQVQASCSCKQTEHERSEQQFMRMDMHVCAGTRDCALHAPRKRCCGWRKPPYHPIELIYSPRGGQYSDHIWPFKYVSSQWTRCRTGRSSGCICGIGHSSRLPRSDLQLRCVFWTVSDVECDRAEWVSLVRWLRASYVRHFKSNNFNGRAHWSNLDIHPHAQSSS